MGLSHFFLILLQTLQGNSEWSPRKRHVRLPWHSCVFYFKVPRMFIKISFRNAYRKLVHKSRGLAMCIFQLFDVCYSRAASAMFCVCKTHESCLAHSGWCSETETWLCECHKIVSKCKQSFWHAKTVEFNPPRTILGPAILKPWRKWLL